MNPTTTQSQRTIRDEYAAPVSRPLPRTRMDRAVRAIGANSDYRGIYGTASIAVGTAIMLSNLLIAPRSSAAAMAVSSVLLAAWTVATVIRFKRRRHQHRAQA